MRKSAWVGMAIIGLFLCVAYLPRAYLVYFRFHPYENGPGQVDVNRRWQEVHYVLRGRNPYDVTFAHLPAARAIEPAGQRGVTRNSEPFADLGIPDGVVYPPWAYPSEVVLHWMPRGPNLWYYAVCMMLGLVVVALWSAAQMRGEGWLASTGVALAVAACASWGGAVCVGNNPAIVVAALVLCHWLLEKKLDRIAGLALGFAMLKPTVAGPFFLALLVGRRWLAAVVAGLYVAVASVLTWKLTHTNPLEMLGQMSAASRLFFSEGFGPVEYLIHLGISTAVATRVVGVTVLVAGFAAMLAAGSCSLLTLFALAAVTSRLWTYHLYYDDAVLIFPLVFLMAHVAKRAEPGTFAAAILLSISLWIPGRLGQHHLVQVFHLSVWVLVAALIAFLARDTSKRNNLMAVC